MREKKEPSGVFYYWKGERPRDLNARAAGVYCRAEPEDTSILDGQDDRQRVELISERLRLWKSMTSA